MYQVNEFVNLYLTSFAKRRLKPSTYDSYVRNAKHIDINKRLDELTTMDLQNVINELTDAGLSYSSINHVAVVLRQSLKKAAQLGFCSYSIWTGVELPSKERTTINILDDEEYRAFVTVCNKGISVYGDIFLFILNTGLRAGEAIALKWENVSLKKNTIEVCGTAYKGKVIPSAKTTAGNRIIPLNKTARDILLRQPISEYCFTNSLKAMICYSSLRDGFHRVLNRIGRSSGGLHLLRHTFATRLLKSGVDIKTISSLLGHSDEYITMHYYLHPDIHQLQSAVNSLDVLNY